MGAAVSYLLMLQKYINSKQKKSEIKDYALYLGNVLQDVTINNMKKKTGLRGVNLIDINNILDVHRYLMKRT